MDFVRPRMYVFAARKVYTHAQMRMALLQSTLGNTVKREFMRKQFSDGS